jgi:hypothetical protein
MSVIDSMTVFGSFLRASWLVLPPPKFTRAWEPTLSWNQLRSKPRSVSKHVNFSIWEMGLFGMANPKGEGRPLYVRPEKQTNESSRGGLIPVVLTWLQQLHLPGLRECA